MASHNETNEGNIEQIKKDIVDAKINIESFWNKSTKDLKTIKSAIRIRNIQIKYLKNFKKFFSKEIDFFTKEIDFFTKDLIKLKQYEYVLNLIETSQKELKKVKKEKNIKRAREIFIILKKGIKEIKNSNNENLNPLLTEVENLQYAFEKFAEVGKVNEITFNGRSYEDFKKELKEKTFDKFFNIKKLENGETQYPLTKIKFPNFKEVPLYFEKLIVLKIKNQKKKWENELKGIEKVINEIEKREEMNSLFRGIQEKIKGKIKFPKDITDKTGLEERKKELTFLLNHLPTVKIVTAENGNEKTISIQERRNNRQNNNKQVKQQYILPSTSFTVLENGKMRSYGSNEINAFKKNPAYQPIMKKYEKSKKVECAGFLADDLNREITLPGTVIAGDAWSMKANLEASNVAREIAFNEKRGKDSFSKADYSSSTYQKTLAKAYEKIEEGFQKTDLPMILGAHFIGTATDGRNGDLTRAFNDYKNKTRWTKKEARKKGKPSLAGKLKQPIKPSPNSHVFAMRKELVSEVIDTRKGSLEALIKKHWERNRHPDVRAKQGGTLDLHSPLLKNLEIIDANTGKEIGSLYEFLHSKEKRSNLPEKIRIKGIGVRDEIGGPLSRKNGNYITEDFLAFRLATKKGEKAMYTFVFAEQLYTESLEKDKGKFSSVLNGITLSEVTLGDEFKKSNKFRKKYKTLLKDYLTKNKKKRTRKQLIEVKNKILGNVLELLADELLFSKFHLNNEEKQDARFFYSHFFNISGYSNKTVLPIFSSKKDLMNAISQFKETVENDTDNKLINIENSNELLSIKKLEIGRKGKRNILEIMQFILEKNNFSKKRVHDPNFKIALLTCLNKLAVYNKNSYFSEIFREVKEKTSQEKQEIYNMNFAKSSEIYYTEDMFNEFKIILENSKLKKEEKNIDIANKLFKNIPIKYLRDKLHFPFSAKQIYAIANNNPYIAQSLIQIAYRERYKGKEDARKSTSLLDLTLSYAGDLKDDIGAVFKSGASAGILQISLSKYKNKDLKKIMNMVILRTDTLIKKGIITLSPKILQNYEILKNRIKQENFEIKDWKGLFKVILIDSPEINFVMGAIMLENGKRQMKALIQRHQKNPNIDEETIRNYQVEAWSGPKKARLHMKISILEGLIFKEELYSSKKMKELKKFEDKNRGKKIKHKEIKKLMNRLEYMTIAILDEIGDANKNPNKLRDHFLKVSEQQGISIESFIENIKNEVNKSPTKMMLAQGSSLNFITDTKYPFFTTFFKELQNYDPELSVRFNFEVIGDKERKQAGNYLEVIKTHMKNIMNKQNKKKKKNKKKKNEEDTFSKNEINKQKILLELKRNILRLDQFINKQTPVPINSNHKYNAIIIQKILTKLNFYNGEIDGLFGKASYLALTNALSSKRENSKVTIKRNGKISIAVLIILKEMLKEQADIKINEGKITITNIKKTLSKVAKASFPNINFAISSVKGVTNKINKINKEIAPLLSLLDETPLNLRDPIINNENAKIIQRVLEKITDYRGVDGNFGKGSYAAVNEILKRENKNAINPNSKISKETLEVIIKAYQKQIINKTIESAKNAVNNIPRAKNRKEALNALSNKWLHVDVNKNEEKTKLTGISKFTLKGLNEFLNKVRSSENENENENENKNENEKYFEYKNKIAQVVITGAAETNGGHEMEHDFSHEKGESIDLRTNGNTLTSWIKKNAKLAGYRIVKGKRTPLYQKGSKDGEHFFLLEDSPPHIHYNFYSHNKSSEYLQFIAKNGGELTNHGLKILGVMRSPENDTQRMFPNHKIEILNKKLLRVHCTTEEAIKYSEYKKNKVGNMKVVFYITDAKQPRDQNNKKEYIALQGTSSPKHLSSFALTKGCVRTLAQSADSGLLFGNGSIFQFFPIRDGTGGIGSKELGLNGISFELALNANRENGFGVDDPLSLGNYGENMLQDVNLMRDYISSVTMEKGKKLPIYSSKDFTSLPENISTHIDDFSSKVRKFVGIPQAKQSIEELKKLQKQIFTRKKIEIAKKLNNKEKHSYEFKEHNENDKNNIMQSIEKLKKFGAKTGDKVIVVRPKDQTMYVVNIGKNNDFNIEHKYLISTATNGLGQKLGSNKTAFGVHRVYKKIGENAKLGTEFVARQKRNVEKITTDATDTENDKILTRVIWMNGIDRNAGNLNNKNRTQYFHGTNEEGLLGSPASHGCIRMGNQDVITLFNIVSEGRNGTLIDIQNN